MVHRQNTEATSSVCVALSSMGNKIGKEGFISSIKVCSWRKGLRNVFEYFTLTENGVRFLSVCLSLDRPSSPFINCHSK